MSSFDVTTHSLAEFTSDSTKNKFNVDEILGVWYAIGNFISSQLCIGKGIKLPSFGVFSLSQSSSPIFSVSSEFSSMCKVKQVQPVAPSNIPTMLLNFASIAQKCKLDRDLVEKIYNKFISCLSRLVFDGRSVLVSVRNVAEITLNRGQLNVQFSPEFLNNFNSTLHDSKTKTGCQLNSLRPQSAVRGRNDDKTMRNETNRPATPSNRRNSVKQSSLTEANISRLTRSYSTSLVPEPRTTAARITSVDNHQLVDRIRAKIIERGGNSGIRTITRLLMIMDDNGDKRISKDELKYGLRDYGIDLNPVELEQIFAYFDRDRSGFIDITEFLVGLRGELNGRRKSMIRMAFDVLDVDRSGSVSIEEVMNLYDFTQDPDVREGRKTIQQAARDFMTHWERGSPDGQITYDEFEDYYRDISASIDDDDYFELMIRNAWHIAGGKGQAANSSNRRVLVTKADGTQSVETINNDLGLKRGDKEGMRNRLNQQGINASNIETTGYAENKVNSSRSVKPQLVNRGSMNQNISQIGQVFKAWDDSSSAIGDSRRLSSSENKKSSDSYVTANDPMSTLRKILYTPPVSLEQLCNRLQVSLASNQPRMAMGAFKTRISTLDPGLSKVNIQEIYKHCDPNGLGHVDISVLHDLLSSRYGKDKTTSKNNSNVIERAKAKILERCGGQAGIKGLTRVLAIMDNNGDKRLTRDELKDGLFQYGIELNIRELEDLFSHFDRDRSGFIDITEFLVGMRGDLNDRRKQFVQMAFNILDRDGSGVITIDEIASAYDVSANPEVISGRKTKDQAYREFISHFTHGKDPADNTVTYAEFEDYYKEISASIDGDDYFELMIRNAWHIAGGKGQAANSSNRRVLVTKADGTQSVETINNDLGLKRGDKEGMRSRLNQQGINASNIETTGYAENTNKARNPSSTPRGLANGSSEMPQRKTFDRNMAAIKVEAAFRGKLARKQYETEKRKSDAEKRRKEEEEVEAARQRPRQILRPKGKSYIGF